MKKSTRSDIILVIVCSVIIATVIVIEIAVSKAIAKESTGIWVNTRVERVVDGDTFVFNTGVNDYCRMVGYNAPEKKEDPELYKAAKDKLLEIFLEAKGRIMFSSEGRDKWNRLLCQVYLEDGTDVNAEMRAWLEDQGYEGVGKYDHLGGAK